MDTQLSAKYSHKSVLVLVNNEDNIQTVLLFENLIRFFDHCCKNNENLCSYMYL
jgi:hypothetical protein